MSKLTEEEKIIKSRESTKKLIDNFKISVEKAKENIIVSPIYIPIERISKADKKYALNMNTYRNLQFHINNQLKIKYKEWMRDQLKWIKFNTPLEISYTLYRAHKSDLMNVVSIVDKFFCDALQYYECILNDNIDCITNYYLSNWWKDRDFPRVEILIYN